MNTAIINELTNQVIGFIEGEAELKDLSVNLVCCYIVYDNLEQCIGKGAEILQDSESDRCQNELVELDSIGELNRTVEEIVDALASSTTIEEVYSKISDYGKAKIARRKAKREKII